ncbi:MAG TPA: YncE family protein [Chloroflexia bacterium]|nr:YncE family protein [Chloroflexia bacterium]
MKVRKQKIIWSSAGVLAALMWLASCGDNKVISTVSVQTTSSTVASATVTSVPSKSAANATAQVVTTKSPQTASSINTPATSTTANKGKPSLETINDIALPGDTSRFDYQSLDPQANLLFMAHLGASTVIVFDTNQNKVVATIAGIASVHGVLAVPELGRVYASATGDKQVAVIDEKPFKVIATIPAGEYPDGLAYDLRDQTLYVSDEGGPSESVIDTQTNKLLTTIDLGGEAGNTQYDPVTGHILIDVQSLNQLVVVDPKNNKIITRYPLAGCQNNHSLALDVSRRLAFITCDGNARLLVMDLETMQIVYEDSVGANPDVLALDNSRSLLYVACESGIVSIFDESKPVAIHKVWEGFVAKEAHTIAVNNQNQQLYLPLENIGGKPVLRIMRFPW